MGPYLKLLIRSLSLMCLVQATWARYATFGSGLFHFISHIERSSDRRTIAISTAAF